MNNTNEQIHNSSIGWSAYLLLAANFIPIIGVLFWGWDSQLILVLYWIENLIIGALTIVRMAGVGFVTKDKSAIVLMLFFSFHFGAFCSGHGYLLTDLLGMNVSEWTQTQDIKEWPFIFGVLQLGWNTLLYVWQHMGNALLIGVLALALSRIASWIEHFLVRGEIQSIKLRDLMLAPYRQILILHVGLMVGAFLLTQFNSPLWLLIAIVLVKTIVDYKQHVRKHQQDDGQDRFL